MKNDYALGAEAHPRSRGENSCSRSARASARGSSPLTRGKQSEVTEAMEMSGLIPAHAGKTQASGPARQPFPAHPRSRGENTS